MSRLPRGPSRFWAMLHRLGLVHARMNFWRVVVEGRLNRTVRRWPAHAEGAVMAIFVWARSIEEAEGLASLAAEEEGLSAQTADATKAAPAAMPKTEPNAVAKGEIHFLPRIDGDARTDPPSRRGAKA